MSFTCDAEAQRNLTLFKVLKNTFFFGCKFPFRQNIQNQLCNFLFLLTNIMVTILGVYHIFFVYQKISNNSSCETRNQLMERNFSKKKGIKTFVYFRNISYFKWVNNTAISVQNKYIPEISIHPKTSSGIRFLFCVSLLDYNWISSGFRHIW